MASIATKINKQSVSGTTRRTALTIPETIDIIKKPGNATSQHVITAAYKTGLWTIYGIKKDNENMTCNN
jgi:hypothetical protein